MSYSDKLYHLNSDHIAESYGDAAMLIKKRDYFSRILFSGEDAAIEVAGEKVATILAGDRNHRNECFRDFVESNRLRLLAAAAKKAEPTSVQVVITGVWHNASHPRFEPYLIHQVGAAGETQTRKYDLKVFPGDELGDGPVVRLRLYDTDGRTAHQQLRYVTEAEIDLDERLEDLEVPDFVQGMVWYPDPRKWKYKLPIIVCRAQGKSKSQNTAQPLAGALP